MVKALLHCMAVSAPCTVDEVIDRLRWVCKQSKLPNEANVSSVKSSMYAPSADVNLLLACRRRVQASRCCCSSHSSETLIQTLAHP